MNFLHPITPDRPWLAPLAGYSDLPFRLLCRTQGCAVAVTEMISAKGLIYGSPGTRELLLTCRQDDPLVVQLFGAEESFLLASIAQLRQSGFRYFDLNCGCSVRKVVRTGSGAALLKDPGHLLRLAKSLVQAVEPGCMGFKIRLGWSHDQPVYLRIGQELDQSGAGWITMHPRYATQGFTGHADWKHLALLKTKVGFPVVASGDLFHAEDGIRCIEQTGVDGLMFARGALNDPGIFKRYLLARQGQPLVNKKPHEMLAMVRKLCGLYTEHGMDRLGILKMRTLVPRLFKGIPGTKELRREIVFCKSWEDVLCALQACPVSTSL